MFSFQKEIESKIVVERSKFLSFAFFCSSKEEQKTFLLKLKAKHKSATHICFGSAYFEKSLICYYSSDDGEPSGTAGQQILQAIKENQLVNVLLVVVRYFGGIKLGVAGLGRAYKESALRVIENNKKPVELKTRCKIKCLYSEFDKIKNFLQDENNICNQKFDKEIEFETYLSKEEFDFINKNFSLPYFSTFEEKYC